MNCKYCQASLEEENGVCPVCGKAQEETAAPAVEETVTAEAAAEEAVTEETAEEEAAAAEAVAEETAVEQTAEEAVALEETPVKRRTWLKVTAVICCVALLLSLGAGVWYSVNGGWAPRKNNIYYKDCYTAEDSDAVKAADKVVATVGDCELTNGQLQAFYWMGVYNFLNEYSYYLSYIGLDVTQPMSEQISMDGVSTWEQYFLNNALNNWHNYQSLMLAADAAGYEPAQDLQDNLQVVRESMDTNAAAYGFESADALVQADMGAAASMEAYMAYVELYYSSVSYFDHLYTTNIPTREEVEAHYNANGAQIDETYGVSKDSGYLVDVRHILVIPQGGTTDSSGNTTYTQEEWDTCLAEAEALLDTWQNGEATEDSFAILANQNSEDPGSNTNGGLYTYVYQGQMVPQFNDWCFDASRQYGDTGIVKTDYGYHIMYYVCGDEGWLRYSEQDLITQRCTQAMEEAMEQYPMEVNFKKIVLSNVELAG